jgi:ATP-dependent Clp protease ATP-binding subunit ClpC
MFEKFTEKALQVIMISQEESRRLGHNFVGTEQIVLGLIGEKTGIANKVLISKGVNLLDARVEVERLVRRGSGYVAPEIPFTPRAKKLLEDSHEQAKKYHHGYIGTEHLLLAILEDPEGVGIYILQTLGLNLDEVKEDVLKEMEILDKSEVTKDPFETDFGKYFRQPKGPYAALALYTNNLNNLALVGRLDPVIGRKNEIERLIQILCRRRKNNPILIGEPGVGKTAVAEGLAERIINQEVPDIIQDKVVIVLDISLLLAGTKYRGEFEDRLKKILEEVQAAKEYIIVIDEVHTLVGAGAAEGALDAANILKPALARGELQCIGATTLDEYRLHIEKDPALERRFQPVHVGEPTVDETIEILEGLRLRYELHHGLQITDGAICAAAKLSSQYIADRFLPDKAIDLLDEASARVRLQQHILPLGAKELSRDLQRILREKAEFVRQKDYLAASVCQGLEEACRRHIRLVIQYQKEESERKYTNKNTSINEEVNDRNENEDVNDGNENEDVNDGNEYMTDPTWK